MGDAFLAERGEGGFFMAKRLLKYVLGLLNNS